MESKFTGRLLGAIGIDFLAFFLTLITLGIGAPWAYCKVQRWYAKHTTLDGHQVVFDGTGGQLFGSYIKWFFLTIITVGIYSLWLPLKLEAWRVSHTHLI